MERIKFFAAIVATGLMVALVVIISMEALDLSMALAEIREIKTLPSEHQIIREFSEEK
jgi:hypothetical protein